MFPNGTITIHSVTDKDNGDYLCVARNKMGDDYVLLRVNVLTRPAKIKQRQQQSSQEVIYGGDLKVDCVASGLPNPEISWALPDGTMVNPVKQSSSGGRSRRYELLSNSCCNSLQLTFTWPVSQRGFNLLCLFSSSLSESSYSTICDSIIHTLYTPSCQFITSSRLKIMHSVSTL